jgi:hypothetical protein
VPLRNIHSEAVDGSRSFLVRVAVGLAALIGVVSFVSLRGGSSTTDGSTTTAASTTSPIGVAELAPSTSIQPGVIPATALGTLPPDAIPLVGLRTPQAAARNLWDAWRDRDRPRALLYASVDAVDALFEATWIPQVRQAGCTPLEKFWLCRFEGPRHRWDATIPGDAEAGYRVSSVRIGEPAGDLVAPAELPSVTNTVPIITNPDGSAAMLGPSLPPGASLPSTVLSDTTLVPGQAASTEPGNTIAATDGSVPVTKRSKPVTTVRPKRSSTSKPKKTQAPETAAAQEAPAAPAKGPDPTTPRKAEPPSEPASGPVPVQGSGSTPVPLEP